jgi:hypothetical protein
MLASARGPHHIRRPAADKSRQSRALAAVPNPEPSGVLAIQRETYLLGRQPATEPGLAVTFRRGIRRDCGPTPGEARFLLDGLLRDQPLNTDPVVIRVPFWGCLDVLEPDDFIPQECAQN